MAAAGRPCTSPSTPVWVPRFETGLFYLQVFPPWWGDMFKQTDLNSAMFFQLEFVSESLIMP